MFLASHLQYYHRKETIHRKNKTIEIIRRHLCCNAIVGSLRISRPSGILHTMVLSEPLGGLIVREPTVIQEQRLVKD